MKQTPEMILSKSVCQALRTFVFYFFHPASEGKRTPWERAQFAINGGRAGVSDLIIVLQSEVVFVELKADKGRQSPVQKEFQTEIERRNHRYLIWRSIDDAIQFAEAERRHK